MWYQRDAEVLTIHIYVQPSAKNTEIVGLHEHELKIRLNSSPIEGRANKELLKYIARLFNVPLRQVTLKRGDKSRHKTLIVIGSLVDPECFIHIAK